MKYFNFKIAIILTAIISFGFAPSVFGASFNVIANQETYKIGDQFNVDIKIDSQDIGINAGQATIKFSPAVLEVVKIDKTSSVFNFWIQEPESDNSSGEISFIGGATSGLVGKSLQVIRIVFKAKGLGESDFIFTDGAITASDGSGTNVLSAMEKATVNVTSTTSNDSTVRLIERTPIEAATVPAKPVVSVPLYSDPNKWYNTSSKFTASWKLPNDISAVATLLNKYSTSNPTESKGIYDNETFSALSDGIWYLHVRFYNNLGWSQTNHYRLAVDTVPPSSFEINFSDNSLSTNPTPIISYNVADQLSGINNYYIQVDNGQVDVTNEKTYTLSPQAPGKHVVKVGVQDKAGNKVESSAEFEILPIESPKIFSVSTNVYVGEGELIVSGMSLPDTSVILDVKDQKGNVIYSFIVHSDNSGIWTTKIDSPLKKGVYYVEATAKDSREALSLPVKSDFIKVQERPIMIIWGISITYIQIIIFLLFVLVAGYTIGWYSNNFINRQRQRKILISQRDVAASFNNIKRDIDAAIKSWDDKKVENHEITQIEFLLRKVSANIEKLQKYIISDIKDIGNK